MMATTRLTKNLIEDGYEKVRTEEIYLCRVLGFPVQISNIDIYQKKGNKDKEVADIDYDALTKDLMLRLIIGKEALTGSQARFIRKSLFITQSQLADMLGLSRMAIVKWESEGNKQTKMLYTTEVVYRMKMLIEMGKSRSIAKTLRELPVGAFKKPQKVPVTYHA